MVKTIEWADGKVVMLDQSRLPVEVVYLECDNYHEVADCIRNLKIRGAPAIGIAAAMGVALAARDIKADGYDDFMRKLGPAFEILLATRPTAVNIKWAVEGLRRSLARHREETVESLKELLKEEAEKILREDGEINRAIGMWGAQFIHDGDTILTHCNAGALATGGFGTATAPMLIAREQGKKFDVVADETRPVLQGARLTAWELMQEGIPVTLITDNTAGALMKKGEISLAIVGTDRTAFNGDVANKIGTYTVAVLCKEHGIPFYVAAPLSSIDFSISSGDLIPIEERNPDEVTTVFGSRRIAPEGVKVKNLAFDVTPAKYVTAIITEKGAFRPEDLKALADPDADVEKVRIKTP
jgi:methylthioribose-1-phosphate isomerase